ncbi:SpoIIIAH-like family protein [Paenibacillus sp. PL2-23]|uniref:SpoIIIAH-like family protein n=1 Tax=Paenibacillus sp. PL2-23 TaxID=2100729 RepID=UPI0030F92024
MNTKRQTIWLVSMLSLMVVLSAYYLFTQDLDDVDKLSGSNQPSSNVTEVVGGSGEVVPSEVVQAGDQSADGMTEEEILKEIERQGLAESGLFSELMAKRDQQNEDELNRLLAQVTNLDNDAEESAAAMAGVDQLEEKNAKIMELEAALKEQYNMAVISQEDDRYKVIVTSQSLEKKDAAHIIDQIMTAMEVGAHQVSVQYVPEAR